MDPSEPDNTAQQASDNRLKRDEIFYFRDVVFLVDGVLFKVPRRNFEENSEVFWTMYTLPPVAGVVPDGTDDEHPLLLERISAEDFRCLLRIMFAPKYSDNQELSLDEWTAVLRLASMWQFTQIRDLVIDVLDQSISNPISRIMLARKYSITEWFIPALNALAQRREPLRAPELHELGLDFAARVMEMREAVVLNGCTCQCTYCGAAHRTASRIVTAASCRLNHDFTPTIRTLFAQELAQM